MSDLQQSSFANVQAPVFDPIPVLGATRPPDVRGLLQTVPLASLVNEGLKSGMDVGKDFASLPLYGKQLQAKSAQLDTELALQKQGQETLQNPTVQQYAPGTTSFSPGGGVSRGPVPLSPLMMGGMPPAAPGAQMGGPTSQGGQTAPGGPATVPVDQGHQSAAQTLPYTPDDALDYYKKKFGTNAKDAVVNPKTGRFDITLKDGTIQPLHPGFMQQNLGTWVPPSQANTPNSAMANPPRQSTDANVPMAKAVGPIPYPIIGQDPNAVSQATGQAIAANTANAINPPQAPAPQHPLTTLQQQGYGLPGAVDPDPNRFYNESGLSREQASQIGQSASNPNVALPSGLKATPNQGNWHGASVTAPNGGQIYYDQSSKLPYYIKGATDTEEVRQYMDGSQPQVVQIPKQYQPNQKINDMIAEQGFGDGTKMNDDEHSAAYRQAMAKQDYEKKPDMPESSAARMEFTREATTQAVQLEKTVSQMSPTERDSASQYLNSIVQQYGPRLEQNFPQVLKDIKAKTGVDLNQSNPNLVTMLQQYGTLKDLIAEGKARAGLKDVERDTLTSTLGDPKLKDFPDNLHRFIGTLGSSLSMQVDHGLSQNWKMPQSAVNEANLVQHKGISGLPGSMQASPVQVANSDAYNKLPKGTWFQDPSTGKSYQKQQ